MNPKEDNPSSVTFLVRTPIFEWFVLQEWTSQDMFSKEIGQCVQETVTILGSIVNINGEWGDLCDYSLGTRIFTLIMN